MFVVTPILQKALDSLSADEDSPYADAERRSRMMLMNAQTTGSEPRLVAETIERAVTTNEPKLRYPVGDDARALISGRARMGDEEWVALGREMTDDAYFQEFSARFAAPTEV